MPRELADLAPDTKNNSHSSTQVRTGYVRNWWVNREAAVLIGVAMISMAWLIGSQSDREPPPMHSVRTDPQTKTIAFALSDDRSTIATARADGHVALRGSLEAWNVRRILHHHSRVWALAFAPDGRSLALGGEKPGIIVFDLTNEGAAQNLKIPIQDARALAFSPDGRTLAALSGRTDEIILWDMAANQERACLHCPSPALSLAFSRDGRSLASGGYKDRAIIIWDLATGGQRLQLTALPGPATVTALVYSPDGSLLASTSRFEGRVRIWDRAGREVRVLDCHSAALSSVAFAPEGRLLATGDDSGTAKLWSMADGQLVATLNTYDTWLCGVAFSSDGRTLVTVGLDHDIQLWDVSDAIEPLEERTGSARDRGFPNTHLIRFPNTHLIRRDQRVKAAPARSVFPSRKRLSLFPPGHRPWKPRPGQIMVAWTTPIGRSSSEFSHRPSPSIWTRRMRACTRSEGSLARSERRRELRYNRNVRRKRCEAILL
jgi:hypothetical protein